MGGKSWNRELCHEWHPLLVSCVNPPKIPFLLRLHDAECTPGSLYECHPRCCEPTGCSILMKDQSQLLSLQDGLSGPGQGALTCRACLLWILNAAKPPAPRTHSQQRPGRHQRDRSRAVNQIGLEAMLVLLPCKPIVPQLSNGVACLQATYLCLNPVCTV